MFIYHIFSLKGKYIKYLNNSEFAFMLALHLRYSICTIFVSHCVKYVTTWPYTHNLEFKCMLTKVMAADKIEFLKYCLAW